MAAMSKGITRRITAQRGGRKRDGSGQGDSVLNRPRQFLGFERTYAPVPGLRWSGGAEYRPRPEHEETALEEFLNGGGMELGMGEVKPPRSVAGVVRGRKKMTESHVAVGRHYSRAGIEPCTRFEASFDRESSETDGSPPTETAGLEYSQYLTQAVLDEIGDLPLELQPKILRVIQERQFERPGGAATIHTDVRVVCATHRNLAEMIEDQEFRADLFYRLSVFPIELPPLRERPEDIRLLVQHFAMDYAARARKSITGISDDFMAAISRHPWPGKRPGVAELHRTFGNSQQRACAGRSAVGTQLCYQGIDACDTGRGAAFAHPSDAPANGRRNRWPEWCCRPARLAADDPDRPNEATGALRPFETRRARPICAGCRQRRRQQTDHCFRTLTTK